MKNRDTTQKNGVLKRLLNESLILSCLGKISSRLISFFDASAFSRVMSGVEASDGSLLNGGIGTAADKHKIKHRVTGKIKTKFAFSTENSILAGFYRNVVGRIIYTPLRTVGAFVATLGIYIGLVYFVKLYGFRTEAAVKLRSLVTGCVLLVFSLFLFLSRATLIESVRGSVFLRNMFDGIIDLDSYTDKKPPITVGAALIAGSVLGVLTFFCGEDTILFSIAAVVYFLLVLYSPEFGLLASAIAFPFCGRTAVSVLIGTAFASYILKVLRGKRNFRVCASNVFVLLLGLCFLFALMRGGGENAWFAFCMTALYILAANLLTTPALLNKCVLVMTSGLGIAVAVFALQVFGAALDGSGVYEAVTGSYSVFGSCLGFLRYLTLMLPFVYCKTENGTVLSKLCCYLFAAGCVVYSVMSGYTMYAVLAAFAVSLYLAVRGRQIFRPLILCFGLPVCCLYFAALPVSFGDTGIQSMFSGWISGFKAGALHFMTGVGMSEESVSLAFSGDSHSMYVQIFIQCGIFGFLLLLLAVFFAIQRVYSNLSAVGTANRTAAAAAGAAVITGFLMALGSDIWADGDICYIFWLCLGLAGTLYEIRKEERRGMNDEQDG